MKLEIENGIKIEIYNKNYAMGHYYPEDDWSIETAAPTYEKAIELIIPRYVESGIYPSGQYISNVKYVTYDNKQHIIYDSDKIPSIYKNVNIILDIEKHPLFKKLFEKKQEKLKTAKIKKEIRIRKKKQECKKKLLKRLKKKYDK